MRDVILYRAAKEDLRLAYRWAARRAPLEAARWMGRLYRILDALSTRAEACPRAPEAKKVVVDLRQFLFGRKPNVFRVLYYFDETAVRIIRVRRAQRRFLTRHEINDAIDSGE